MNTSDLLAQVPASSDEAERSVLGAVLIENKALAEAVEVLELQDFYRESHRKVFDAMLRLDADRAPIDAITLADVLKGRGELEHIGGPAYLAELASGPFAPSAVAYYAKIVHDLAVVRDFGERAHTIAMASFEARDADQFLSVSQARLDEVHARLRGAREPGTAETLARVLGDLRSGKRVPRIGTGFSAFDRTLDGGLGRGELTVLAGQTGRGKSALALNIAAAAAEASRGALYVSVEMGQAHLAERALCAKARVSLSARLRGLRPEELDRLSDAQRALAACPLEICYRPGLTPTALRALALRHKREHGLDLLVVDYVGLMRPDRREERREREVASITLALKHLAGELNIAVLALSQFNRQVDRREDRVPRLSDLRDSGALEQDADLVLFLYEKREGDDGDERQVDLIVAKNRRGLCWATIPLCFIARQTRFAPAPTVEEGGRNAPTS